MEQSEIGKLLVSKAKEGLRVVRPRVVTLLFLADVPKKCWRWMNPFLRSSTRSYCCLGLCGLCGYTLVSSGFWLVHVFLTGHEDVAKESLRVDFAKFSEVGGTLCIYMGMRQTR